MGGFLWAKVEKLFKILTVLLTPAPLSQGGMWKCGVGRRKWGCECNVVQIAIGTA